MSQDELFDQLAERMQRMQLKAQAKARKRNPAAALRRGFHAKGLGVRAKFQVKADIPAPLRVGLFQPDASCEALARFSNARGEVLGDLAKDQRGIAIRLKARDQAEVQDFLMTNTPISFARSPLQFIEVGEILLDGIAGVIPKLLKKYGMRETRRILGVFLAPILSFKPFQMNTYWSRTSYQFGERAVRFLLRPAAGSVTWTTGQQLTGVLRSLPQRENYLRQNLVETLRAGERRFDFCVQLFVDPKRTPIEDAYIEWKEADAPPVAIATLILPRQDFDPQLQTEMEGMAFNPWNTRDFTPLGAINLSRKKVYDASAMHRGAEV